LSVDLSGRRLDGKSSQKDYLGSERRNLRAYRKSFEKRAPYLDTTGLAYIEVFQDGQCQGLRKHARAQRREYEIELCLRMYSNTLQRDRMSADFSDYVML
jgi:hypothetical protein